MSHHSHLLNSSDHSKVLNYMSDFSAQAQHYRDHSNEEALLLLNRSVGLLTATIPSQQCFIRNNLTISRFFIDLHAVMSSLSVDTDVLWSCVALLQHYSRNLDAHHAMVHEYRFIPLLAHVLVSTPIGGSGGERRQRLLLLLQDLTFGIQIIWEEPYLVVLLKHLLEIIHQFPGDVQGMGNGGSGNNGLMSDPPYNHNHHHQINNNKNHSNDLDNDQVMIMGEEELQAQVALSILINLCYKNSVVLFLFLRTVNISQFSRHIQRFGMLANKMLIILSEDTHSPDRQELNAFLKSSFVSIGKCLKSWNVTQLKHTVEFLRDSKAHRTLHQAMLHYQDYEQDIGSILDLLMNVERISSNDGTTEDERKRQQICMEIIFQLLDYILELSMSAEKSGDLHSCLSRIYELLLHWMEEEICGVKAIHLLITLVETKDEEEELAVSHRIAQDPAIIDQLIALSEKSSDIAPDYTVAVLRLLCSLLSRKKTEKLVLAKISESFFDKILAPVINLKPEMPDNILTQSVVEKAVFCMLLLVNFAAIAKKAYYGKCCSLLQNAQVQRTLAKALFLHGGGGDAGGRGSDNNNAGRHVSSAILQIARFNKFPCNEVAEHIADLNRGNVLDSWTKGSQHHLLTKMEENQRTNFNLALQSQRMFANKELEERLRVLIESLTDIQRNNQLTNANTSQIIELFSYKLERQTITEEQLQCKLQQASEEVTCLRQRINGQNSELVKYRTMNFELHIKQESLLVECGDLKTQIQCLKRNVTDLMKKLAEQNDINKINEKRLTMKISELKVLQEEHKDLKNDFNTKVEEMDKLQLTVKENSSRIEKLKKTIGVFEQDLKEKVQRIAEKERELSKTSKLLEEQREAKGKLDEVVNVLETQLQEKNEQIRNYECELNETEELRKTIMSLMESKKPKRNT